MPEKDEPVAPTWKEQARREKERLARELDEQGGEGEGGEDRPLPPPDFMTFLTGLATQALIAMGAAPDPFTGEVRVSLEVARYHIDLIGILEQKTRGNLSPEETGALRAVLSDLRMRFVAVSEGRAAGSGNDSPGGGEGGSADPAKPGRIIIPS